MICIEEGWAKKVVDGIAKTGKPVTGFGIELHGENIELVALRMNGRALTAREYRIDGKRLLIADMDSTIIGCECIDELADFAGVKAEASVITERAMRGELDFEAALRERVWAAMDAGGTPHDAQALAVPWAGAWVGYEARHGFNAQRAWRELEPGWMAR